LYKDHHQNNSVFEKEFVTVSRITALWAFSEAALGGVLHALKIPFTGLFIGGTAVIFLSLIAHFASRKSIIIQATLIVILIKGMVSPYTPLNAYFSVSLQGIIAFVLFSILPNIRIASFLLGIVTLTLSAFQKIFVLTLVFGTTLWESIDAFGDYVTSEFLMSYSHNLQLSYILIGIYGSIHILGGIIFGITAGRAPNWIYKNKDKAEKYNELLLRKDEKLNLQPDQKKKRKVWWKKKSTIFIGLFSVIMITISYLNPQLDNNLVFKIFIMLLRSIIITYIWFGLLSPVIIKWFKKYLLKKKSEYSKEINQILALFPYFKGIINFSWEETKTKKNYKRIIPFLKNTFILLLMADFDSYEKSNSI